MDHQENELWFHTEVVNYRLFYDDLPEAINTAADKLLFRRPVAPAEHPPSEERCLHDDDDLDCCCYGSRWDLSADPGLAKEGNALDKRILDIIDEFCETRDALNRQIVAEGHACALTLEALRPIALDLDKRLHDLPRSNEGSW